ncbi:DUF2808 domain-containing protein [Cyanobium sp. NIES-981]|uniref:DUF2808 domain-containing protein n=1 Tax=Cyanobium sp. NIES-981 TaxID=1851505 RepID=UPI0007DD0B37|nr:DUF2808 domain-containing protein [Cyanobium sp. NIES-981]SBO43035.1 conserved protein of unknown function [Cyanobium sp. NIES-981]
MGFSSPRRALALRAALGGAAALGASLAVGLGGLGPLGLESPARAQGTPGLLEFRWENNRDYRKLYFWMSNTQRLKRSDYYLMLRPKDRKTAILKLSVTIPSHFDAKIDPARVKLCRMSKGGMLSRTRCTETIPATIELAENGGAIEIFPDTPVDDTDTIGVHMSIFNPYSIGMYQFNALAQAPGDVPISGYLGSWLIQIDPPSN